MKNYITDVPVALIFFNRPEVFRQVFECVRENRPSKLFLIQDGPRDNRPDDKRKIEECRSICDNVDWDCEVIKDYSENNLGCGKRIYTGLKNAFKIVDRLVIIEDDILFSKSFLPFCAELLEKYKDDRRINLISGMNHFGEYKDCNKSYFFSRGGAIWGWATWRRVCDEVDWNLPEAEDPYISLTLRRNNYPRNYGNYLAEKSKMLYEMIHGGKSPSYWSFHYLYYSFLQNEIHIVPKYNLTQNIGLTAETTHGSDSLKKLPRQIQKIFFGKLYEIEFPLSHPSAVLDDRYYKNMQDDFMYPRGIKKIMLYLELAIRKVYYGIVGVK